MYMVCIKFGAAAILGFHSMMNQDQYHASLLNKGQPVGLGWDGITKSSAQKIFPQDPPNQTNVDESIKRVKDDDTKLIELNFNNIKVNMQCDDHLCMTAGSNSCSYALLSCPLLCLIVM